jgi:hypothetical protein
MSFCLDTKERKNQVADYFSTPWRSTPLLKNDQCSDLFELLYGAHISAPRRIDLFFQNNRRRKKILSIGLNYFTQIIFPSAAAERG